ncbi:30S ribosomal protein S27ae [Candidatus Woesearchaeota archaeon]|nr:30S ribosomal protein S27ae [Candidatus Woesearchaeota archaeon]
MAEKDKKPAKKGGNRVYQNYAASGQRLERKNKTCPKCGPSVFMAMHRDRVTCGKCRYMEMKRKE